jgi:hypothetical protein
MTVPYFEDFSYMLGGASDSTLCPFSALQTDTLVARNLLSCVLPFWEVFDFNIYKTLMRRTVD